MGADRVLGRRVEANLSALQQVSRMRSRGELAIADAAGEEGRLRARRVVDTARAARRAGKRGDPAKAAAWDRRKKRIGERVEQALDRSALRSPEQVLEDLGELALRRGEKECETRASVVVRAPGSGEDEVRARIEALPGGAALLEAGIEVRPLAVGKAETRNFEIVLPVAAHALRREVLNVSWALARTDAFEAAWPGESRVQLFAEGDPAHATRVPPTFAWHMDMIRGRQAHELEPGHPDGRREGEGSVIVHPDTGWARHPEYNEDRIDKDASRDFEAEPDESGGESAMHSVLLLDKDDPNLTHGTATASLMVGGAPSDRPDIATLPEEDLELSRKPEVDEGHILGVSPAATVVPIRFISEDWELPNRGVLRLSDAHFAEILDHAVSIGADVMSLSVGGMLSDAVRDAFEDAIRNHDLIAVAAAGQTYAWNIISRLSDDSVVEPARFRDVIAVAGSTPDGRAWDESHRGENVDITAPSDAVWVAEFSGSESNDDGERLPILVPGSGTSFGTAVTAGAAALWVAHWGGRARLKETYPDTPLAWVFREVLQRTAHAVTDDPWDTSSFGPGIVDLEALLEEPLPPPDEVPEPPDTVANLLTELEPGLRVLQDLMDWIGGRWADAEAAVGAGAAFVAAWVDGALDTAEGLLADAYAFAEDAGAAAADLAGDAVAAGEQLVDELVNAAEDAGEAAVDAGEDVVEEVGEFVEEGAETVGEAVNEVASWFGL